MIFGIGNPLIDVVIQAQDAELAQLGLDKGIMHLVSEDQQALILHYFKDREVTYLPGGSAPNTLLALAGLEIPAVISGKIGDDEFGRTYAEQVGAYGITSRLVTEPGRTGSSVILVTPDGERTMNTHLGMCQRFCTADVDEALLAGAQYLYFTGYMWDTDLQKDAILHAITRAREAGSQVVFDVADPFAAERYRDDFVALIRDHVDIVFANRREAQLLYGLQEAHECAARLGADVRIAALKVGKDGCLVVAQGDPVAVGGRPITAVDSTGAGDMFAAGFLAGLAWGRSAAEAAGIGGYLAEEVIMRVGAQLPIDRIRELRTELSGPVTA